MSPEAPHNQAGLASNDNLRRRNIHSEEEQEADQQQESSSMKSYVPKSLWQCISGEEIDRTQNVLATPEKIRTEKGPIHMSCNDDQYDGSRPSKKDFDTKDPSGDDTEEVTDLNISYNAPTTVSSMVSSNSDSSGNLDSEYDDEASDKASFLTFRLSYLFVTLVVMLADGLQGELCRSKAINTLYTQRHFTLYSHVFVIIFFRYPSLRLVRGIRILCGIAVLFGIYYRCHHRSYHGTSYRSIWTQKVGITLLRTRGWNQHARTISLLEWSHCESRCRRCHHKPLVHRLRDLVGHRIPQQRLSRKRVRNSHARLCSGQQLGCYWIWLLGSRLGRIFRKHRAIRRCCYLHSCGFCCCLLLVE